MRGTHCQEHADWQYIRFLISEHVEEDILGAGRILGCVLIACAEKEIFPRVSDSIKTYNKNQVPDCRQITVTIYQKNKAVSYSDQSNMAIDIQTTIMTKN
jgi:hypothetical protein